MAAASLLLSLCLTQFTTNVIENISEKDKCWTPTLKYYSKYEVKDLWPLTKQIALLARNAPEDKLKAIYTKYKAEIYRTMMNKEEMYNDILDAIIGKEKTNPTTIL